MSTSEAPAAWGQPMTVEDQLVIQALPADVRASVERYLRATPARSVDSADVSALRGVEDELSSICGRAEDAMDTVRAIIKRVRRTR